ncbi:MAG: polyketide synthase, partial [Acidobacteria bacterium]|nr:polyketide synthase [Acidobacteriota bacterium]
MTVPAAPHSDLDVAVVGLAVRFPGAATPQGFWDNISRGVESVTRLTEADLRGAGVARSQYDAPEYVRMASVLEDIDCFDAEFFGCSPREAALLDPQVRLSLECAWEALEDAGCDPQRFPGPIGVYAAASLNTYLLWNLHHQMNPSEFVLGDRNLQRVLASGQDFLSTRISYKLGLRGPSINVQTACSGALVAIHLARQSLLARECDAAIAGGASIYLPQRVGYVAKDGLILSRDGHCRPFDAGATGTIFGRGLGFVVLRRLADALEDGDRVYAVIKGSAINNDGGDKAGFTAPSPAGQAAVIAEALADAGVSPDTIGYVEAHGTGTQQGDPVEIAGLTEAFRSGTDRKGFCAIGSVKSNIGHLDAAAGAAAFIKTVLALDRKALPPSLNFARPNPAIDFPSTPFYVNTTLRDWPAPLDAPRRAGVSAFGMGGTNAHVVVEEAPAVAAGGAAERSRAVLTLSAKSGEALATLAG